VSWLSQNLSAFFQLLPGFITAGVFYALTAHPKTSEFERIVQALVFTLFLKVLTAPVRGSLLLLGKVWAPFGSWSTDAELAWMIILAFPLGLLVVWIVNKDVCHRWARRFGLTGRTSLPSEWYAAFARERRWIILNLVEGRRLYGWPEEWPDQPDKGHFLIDQPEWVLDDGSRVPIVQTSKFMVPASDVKQVEFLANSPELTLTEDEQRKIQLPLIELHRSNVDGCKGTAAGAEPPTGQVVECKTA
jgi:hypothetical protein